MKKIIKILFIPLSIVIITSCSTKKSVRFTSSPILPGTKIAVIYEGKNTHKNVVISRFLKRGYSVTAINASDMYTIKDLFDIKDIKKLSYMGLLGDSLISMERTYNNIYKLHIYNFEINKTEYLSEIKKKLNVRYLILLSLENWSKISWGRAIDLNNYEIVWVENYPTKYQDELPDVIDHFIESISRKK